MPNLNETLAEDGKTAVTSKDGIVEAEVTEKKPEDGKKPESKKTEKKTKVKKEPKEPKEEKTVRPPMEQLTKDFEASLKDLTLGDKKVIKLEYKCGKVIYGIRQSGQKDFRMIAFKARKKSKSVQGKSRCIFYFGISQTEAKALVKAHPELSISKFGKCSVQSATPVELILDRVTYTEKFGKDIDKVTALMETLVDATMESKKEQWQKLQEKIAAKAEKKEKKAAATKKKKDTKKDADDAE